MPTTDDAYDGATRPSQHPDAHRGELNRDAYSHLRGKRRRRSLLTAADLAVVEARRAMKATEAKKRK